MYYLNKIMIPFWITLIATIIAHNHAPTPVFVVMLICCIASYVFFVYKGRKFARGQK
ncbi:hypothetical protein [Corynebacterium sp. 13CS0277]|uniref:hypothetical protein n=1 Tax=Corynebacterium sp. 13CS0277 TaxID=2071994 RepID=UPI001304E0D8|nr:hypothetical protein [Corynebacterium sp. 13CS0277]